LVLTVGSCAAGTVVPAGVPVALAVEVTLPPPDVAPSMGGQGTLARLALGEAEGDDALAEPLEPHPAANDNNGRVSAASAIPRGRALNRTTNLS
jgi:hypothetical protein